MTNFQRMIAIPQEEYLAMSVVQNVKEPLTQQFYNTEQRFTEHETIRDPYRRLVMQSGDLEEMKILKEQMRNSLGIATPKPYRNRAKGLFQFIENSLRFNKKGEIYDNQNQVIAGSRVEDLIQYAVNDRRRNILKPEGWSEFLDLLREKNVPKNFLNRYTLDEFDGVQTPSHTPNRKRNQAKNRTQVKREVETDSELLEAPRKRIQVKRKAKPDIEFLKKFKI